MGKFENDVKKLLEYVGGKENIAAVSHCVTRMRFVLKDTDRAQTEDIEKLKSVKGTFTQAGQYQVIIGNDVNIFFQEFTAYAGIEGTSKEAAKEAAKKNQNVVQRLVTNLAEIFAPLIPALITGGLILGFRNVIGEVYAIETNPEQAAVFWVGLYNFLWLIGEAIFHFLPVGIVWSITKKMGTTQMLGIVLGITLVSPQLLNAYGVADAVAAGTVPFWDFGFVQLDMIGYQGQVIPAIMAGFALAFLERFFKKITPSSISMIVVPFMSLLLAVIFAHGVLGPIGWAMGSVVSSVVYSGLTSAFGWLFATVFGFFYAPLVITGLHHMTNAIDLQLIGDFGGTILWPMIALSNIAQGSALLAIITMQKNDPEGRQVSIPATISCYLGVTEPALFGVNLKLLYPFICGMIGSAAAATLSVASGVMANSIGVGGLPGILSIQTAYIPIFAVCMAIAIVIPFILTLIVGRKRGLGKVETARAVEQVVRKELDLKPKDDSWEGGVLLAPAAGEAVPVSDVPDPVFGQKLVGDGFAVIPEDGRILSPVDGTVVTVSDTLHAYGIQAPDGLEILVHIGLDTVELKGEGFTPKVKVGQKVRAGEALAWADLDLIKAKGYQLHIPTVVTNIDDFEFTGENYGSVEAGKSRVLTYKKK